MIKLLDAGFTRLKKNKLFWVLSIFAISLALFIMYAQYNEMIKFNVKVEIGQLMIYYSTIIGIVISIFTSLFLGVEYSDGVIRNKINIGHKRINIYLSNLIIISITSIFFYILFIVTLAIIGIPLFGIGTMPLTDILISLGCILASVVAYSSIFTFIAMIISNRTIIAITSIILAFGIIMAATICLNVLQTPEYIQMGTPGSEGMEFIKLPNPRYPSEETRKLCQTLLDINMAGQALQIIEGTATNLNILPLYSIGICTLFTIMGLGLFEEKELK